MSNRKELIQRIAEEWLDVASDNTGMTDEELPAFLVNRFYDVLVQEGLL